MATARKPAGMSIDIVEMSRGTLDLRILGSTPLIMNSMNSKVMRDLLMPPEKKNAAAKASTLKHEPEAEFRRSMYYTRSTDAPTALCIKSTQLKASMMGAALDVPGSSKRQIGRLAWILGDEVPVYGVPKLLMSVVRSADMNRTPDVRTRAILPHWACEIRIEFVTPLLKQESIINLLATAGFTQGIGDFRPEKGAGNYGQYTLVGSDSSGWDTVVRDGGREAQEAAIKAAEPYDSETEELFAWWGSEVKRRGFKVVA